MSFILIAWCLNSVVVVTRVCESFGVGWCFPPRQQLGQVPQVEKEQCAETKSEPRTAEPQCIVTGAKSCMQTASRNQHLTWWTIRTQTAVGWATCQTCFWEWGYLDNIVNIMCGPSRTGESVICFNILSACDYIDTSSLLAILPSLTRVSIHLFCVHTDYPVTFPPVDMNCNNSHSLV